MENLLGYTKNMLEDYFVNRGEKKYKATQVFEWLYRHGEYDIAKFSNIKKSIITTLLTDVTTDFSKIEKV